MNFTIEKEWITESGLPAVITIVELLEGYKHHRCGYVGIREGHPLFQVHYAENCHALSERLEEAKKGPIGKRGIIPIFLADAETCSAELVLNTHGGLTFSGSNTYFSPDSTIWWFGFDCAHSNDGVIEQSPNVPLPSYGEVRSLEYCITECENLAVQLTSL